MAYLIIALVLLFIIVPMFSVLPSARQKEQMAMRTVARRAGVMVALTSIDDPNPKQDKYISPTGRNIPPVLKVSAWRYHRHREVSPGELDRPAWLMQKLHDGGWQWIQQPKNLNPQLSVWLDTAVQSLPADVEQVEESNHMISVYWHEASLGDEDAVIDFLKACAAIEPGIPLIES